MARRTAGRELLEREGAFPLIQYQLVATVVWLLALEFWAIFAVAAVRSSSLQAAEQWLFSWNSSVLLLRTTVLITLVQALLVLWRLPKLQVRESMYAPAIFLLRAVFLYAMDHAVHALAGWAVLYSLQPVLGMGGSQQPLTSIGLLNGALFSLFAVLGGRNEIKYASVQFPRLARVRSILPRSLVSAVTLSLGASLVLCMFESGETVEELSVSSYFARLIMLSTSIQFTMFIGTELQEILLTENKRLSKCTKLPISEQDETILCAHLVSQTDPGSLEEALLSLPTEKVPDVLPYSSLLVKAKTIVGNFAPEGISNDFRRPRTLEASRDLHLWWERTHQANRMYETWELKKILRERRMEAVIQAIYNLDSVRPGLAFRLRGSLRGELDLARAKAFQDLAVSTEFHESRRRSLYNDHTSFHEVFDACSAAIDALTISLAVATRNAAIEPTHPMTKTGNSLIDVFVLGPSPGHPDFSDISKMKELAWQAQATSLRLRRKAWVSAEWWRGAVLSPFLNYDPVSVQFELEQEGEDNRLPRDGADTSGSSRGWEKQWKRQRQMQSHQWLGRFRSLFSRSPHQQISALFCDRARVMWAATTISNLVAFSVKEDELGTAANSVPVTLACLLSCLVAIDDYTKSGAFIGVAEPLVDPSKSLLAREEVLEVQFVLERAVYRISTVFQSRLRHFRFAAPLAERLASLTHFDNREENHIVNYDTRPFHL
mmetsp:Transcript_16941/g.29943  ORF Transcript_16941/g.29943 Transcript_16941/m.29943 type:complete len:717 (+) Transcript_16941:236-2386(+)